MSNNVFIFHGTEGYPEENWFPWLKQELEQKDYNVFVPQFPSPPIVPAKIDEWFEVLKNYEQNINESTIFIGHSLGGIFTLRILEKLKHSIKAAFFVGTPIGVRPILNYDRDSSFGGFTFDWKSIKKNAAHFEVFQSNNDPYVSLGNGQELAKNLGVELNFVPNAGHFNAKAGYLKFEKLRDAIFQIENKQKKDIKDEIFDVLDKDGNFTGKIKPRKEVHQNGDWHKAVHVWIINSKNELLIQKRSPNKDIAPNQWDISVAGHIPAGGDGLTTALREIEEELGVHIEQKNLEYLFTVTQSKTKKNYINNEFNEVYLLKLDLDISKIVLQKEELTEIKFIHFTELEKLINGDNDKIFVSHDKEYKKLFKLLCKR